jgi:hypothetical protein
VASKKEELLVSPVQKKETLYLRNLKKDNCDFIRKQKELAGDGKTLAEVIDEVIEFFREAKSGKGAA